VRITDLETPFVAIERRRVLNNIDRMQAAAAAAGRTLRPHAKTHKSPLIARWQITRGAIGVCCAKLGEAEVFAEAGVADIRLPYPLQPSNAGRLTALMDKARVSFIVDHPAVARGWSDAMVRAGRSVEVLVKVDVGFHRCGVDAEDPGAVEFIRSVAESPGLKLAGLLSHAGHSYGAASEEALAQTACDEASTLLGLADRCRTAGVEIPEISVGTTPNARFSVRHRGVTEMRPGAYVYGDRTQVGLGAAALDDCALTVIATVVSRPAPDRVILDCGSKTLSSDAARGFRAAPGYGAIFRDLEATDLDSSLTIERLSEEHATVRATGPCSLRPGERVRVLPNHCCVVSNLVDEVHLVDGLEVLQAMPVAARGRIT
jgi:D-serine deaminase-like pyridoxal phosphate-dependent protein